MADLLFTSKLQTIAFHSIDPALRTKALYSGIKFTRKMAAQQYAFVLSWTTLTKAEQRSLVAQLRAMRGGVTSFTASLPDVCEPVGDGVATLNTTTAIGDPTISINVSGGTVKAGDLFTFGTAGKVYEAAEDSTGTGIQDLDLVHPMRSAVSSATSMTFSGVKITASIDTDKITVNISNSNRYAVQVTAEEVLT